MGGLVSSLGFGPGGDTGAAGVNYSAGMAPLIEGVNADQADTLYRKAMESITQQQDLLKALQAQGGIQNQTDVYNRFGDIAAGRGPNPAQAMLAQQTGANIANQAALMAGQRGAGANTGLLARQAAMQGGNLQQQAVGQGATLQAQQALNALAQQGNIASQQVGNQIGATQFLNQAAQSEQANILGGIAALNQARVGGQSSANAANSGLANTVAQGQQGLAGSVMGGIGSAITGGLFAHGGKIPKMADGGAVEDPNQPKSTTGKFLFSSALNPASGAQPEQGMIGGAPNYGAQSIQKGAGQMFGGLGKAIGSAFSSGPAAPTQMAGGPMDAMGSVLENAGPLLAFANHGGKVPVMVSPGEKYMSPQEAKAVAEDKISAKDAGKKIPGKAKVKGDSLQNDVVHARLESGGIVIPRSVVNSENPEKAIADFVKAVQAKHGSALKRPKE